MHKRHFLLLSTIIALCTFTVSTMISAEILRSRPDRPDIGSGGGNTQAAATVIIKCAPGNSEQSQGGETESQTGNCSCTQSGNGSSSCSCSSSTQGSGTPPASSGSNLFVKGIYSSAEFPADRLDDIANAESCADAVQLLQSGSGARSGSGDCQFTVDTNPWYSCTL